MNYANRIVALMSGIALCLVSLYVITILAAIPIPTSYYYNRLYEVIVVNGVTLTLPLFVLSLAWSWVTVRLLGRTPRVAIWWCLGGLLGGLTVGFICWQLYHAVLGYYWCLDNLRQYHFSLKSCSERFFYWNSIISEPELITACARPHLGLILWIARLLSVPAGLAAAAWMLLRSEQTAADGSSKKDGKAALRSGKRIQRPEATRSRRRWWKVAASAPLRNGKSSGRHATRLFHPA